MNDKLIYVYTDDFCVIKEIDTTPRGDLIDLNLHIVKYDNASELLSIKQNIDLNPNLKPIYLLIDENDIISVAKGLIVYYDYKDFSIKSITPKILEEFENDSSLKYGIVKIDNFILDIIDGKVNLSYYKVQETKPFLTLSKQSLFEEFWTLDDIKQIKDYNIRLSNAHDVINLLYNRSNQKLTISHDCVLNVNQIELYFTNKNDRTVLINSIKFNPVQNNVIIDDLYLPENVEIYCPLNNKLKFLYREE